MNDKAIYTCSELLTATKGLLVGNDKWHAIGLCMDSREAQSGEVFIALKPDTDGDKYRTSGQDGHNFVQSALDNGAVAVIVDHKMDIDIPQIIVNDTFQAMIDMGQFARNRAHLKQAVAITGSVGKTGVRDMVDHAFQGSGLVTHASIKSYNNSIGVPYTLATMPSGTEVSISEVGMNYPSEITPLSKQIRPDIAIITWIADVHIENFNNGINGIVNAKSEIFNGMDADGVAILPHDNDYYDMLVSIAKSTGLKNIFSFGEHDDADARLINYTLSANNTKITANIMGEQVQYELKIAGKHIACNSLSALLSVKLAGEDVQKAAMALGGIKPIEGRGSREVINLGDKNAPVTLINESYNASCIAMVAAFNVVSMIVPKRNGQRIAVLGDMLELGDIARQTHEGLDVPLVAARFDKLYCCGPNMKHLFTKMPDAMKGGHFENAEKLSSAIPSILKPNDVVLVKGSLGSKMRLVVEAIRSLDKA